MTALRAEGCGRLLAAGRFPFRGAMNIKAALRDLLSVPYGIISILLIGSLRSPPPPIRAAPDFPLFRGRIKHLEASLRKRLYK